MLDSKPHFFLFFFIIGKAYYSRLWKNIFSIKINCYWYKIDKIIFLKYYFGSKYSNKRKSDDKTKSTKKTEKIVLTDYETEDDNELINE